MFKISIIINKYNIKTMIMTKRVRLTIDNIKKADDRQYVNEIYESILNSLYDFENTISNISLLKSNDTSVITFNVKVSKMGDLVLVLIKEFLSCLLETEPNIGISISEIEEGERKGITYRFFNYIPEE